MRRCRVCLLLFLALTVATCARTEPSASPKKADPPNDGTHGLPPGLALRPEFAYGKSEVQETGTAFAVRAISGKRYLVTAAHLYKAQEWQTMRTVTLRDMAGAKVAMCAGQPLFVGKLTEDPPASRALFTDFSEDLAYYQLPDSGNITTVKLASQMPSPGNEVTVIGCERGKHGAQWAYLFRVISVTNRDLTIEARGRFDPEDLSGAPVLNGRQEAVGNFLAGSRSRYTGTTAGVIRAKFKDLGIEIE